MTILDIAGIQCAVIVQRPFVDISTTVQQKLCSLSLMVKYDISRAPASQTSTNMCIVHSVK